MPLRALLTGLFCALMTGIASSESVSNIMVRLSENFRMLHTLDVETHQTYRLMPIDLSDSEIKAIRGKDPVRAELLAHGATTTYDVQFLAKGRLYRSSYSFGQLDKEENHVGIYAFNGEHCSYPRFQNHWLKWNLRP